MSVTSSDPFHATFVPIQEKRFAEAKIQTLGLLHISEDAPPIHLRWPCEAPRTLGLFKQPNRPEGGRFRKHTFIISVSASFAPPAHLPPTFSPSCVHRLDVGVETATRLGFDVVGALGDEAISRRTFLEAEVKQKRGAFKPRLRREVGPFLKSRLLRRALFGSQMILRAMGMVAQNLDHAAV